MATVSHSTELLVSVARIRLALTWHQNKFMAQLNEASGLGNFIFSSLWRTTYRRYRRCRCLIPFNIEHAAAQHRRPSKRISNMPPVPWEENLIYCVSAVSCIYFWIPCIKHYKISLSAIWQPHLQYIILLSCLSERILFKTNLLITAILSSSFFSSFFCFLFFIFFVDLLLLLPLAGIGYRRRSSIKKESEKKIDKRNIEEFYFVASVREICW